MIDVKVIDEIITNVAKDAIAENSEFEVIANKVYKARDSKQNAIRYDDSLSVSFNTSEAWGYAVIRVWHLGHINCRYVVTIAEARKLWQVIKAYFVCMPHLPQMNSAS